MISFVIPAHNEKDWLGRTLRTLQFAAMETGVDFEVIVANDASTDGTAEIARAEGAQVVDVNHRNIAATRNAGARLANGEILFFLDADTLVNPPVIRSAIEAIGQGAVGGGFAFRYDGCIPWWAHILHPLGIAIGRTLRLIGGAALFCRRTDFEAIGGFDANYFATEDLVLVRALKKRGRFVIPRPVVLTSNRKVCTMSLWQALALLYRVLVVGSESYRSREGLELWYGSEARATPIDNSHLDNSHLDKPHP